VPPAAGAGAGTGGGGCNAKAAVPTANIKMAETKYPYLADMLIYADLIPSTIPQPLTHEKPVS
jgi:hypothetical protein